MNYFSVTINGRYTNISSNRLCRSFSNLIRDLTLRRFRTGIKLKYLGSKKIPIEYSESLCEQNKLQLIKYNVSEIECAWVGRIRKTYDSLKPLLIWEMERIEKVF